MNKRIVFFILIILILPITIFSGCEQKFSKKKIEFIVDSEIYATIKTSGKEELSLPNNPTRDCYNFIGWFYDDNIWENVFDLTKFKNEKLENNIKVYAKWQFIGYDFGTINFDVSSEDIQIMSSSRLINFDITSSNALNLKVKLKLATESQSAFYLINISDSENIVSNNFYFKDNEIIYHYDSDILNLYDETNQIATLITHKLGVINFGDTIDLTITNIPNSFTENNSSTTIMCSIYLIQQSDLTEDMALEIIKNQINN